MKNKSIALACDHAAYELKEAVKLFLREKGVPVVDFGCEGPESVHYPDYAEKVARSISNGDYERGILLCGTGIGMSITANKFPRVRAALCHDEFTARASREHNDANILVLGARVLDRPAALQLVEIWLETDFADGRHAERLQKISCLEQELLK